MQEAQKHNTGSVHDKMRLTVLWGLCRYYSIIGNASRYLDENQLGQLQFAVGAALSCYMALATEAQQLGTKCWHIVPKFHMYEHIADTVAPQAPTNLSVQKLQYNCQQKQRSEIITFPSELRSLHLLRR